MHIAFFGASLVSAYKNGAATYYRGLLKALTEHGHSVRFYEPENEERLSHRDILDPLWAQVIRFSPDGVGVEAALDHASNADLIVKSSSIGVFDALFDAAIPRSTASHALSVYWDLDPAQTLANLECEMNHPLRAQLPWYDVVLTRGGGDDVVEAYQRCGARVCFPVYPAVDPSSHYPVNAQSDFRSDFVYLAHRYSACETQAQQSFFDVAASLAKYRFVLGGCGWENVPMPENVHYVNYVYTAEHNLYYASAIAALNLTSSASARWGYAPSARLFEAAGAATCVITDAWPGIEAFFEPGREVLVAHDTAQVVEHLSTLLTGDRATAIGKRAHARCVVEHTYERRVGELEALLEGFDRQWVNRTAL